MRRRNVKGAPYVPDNAIVLYKTDTYGPNPNPEVMEILQKYNITDRDYMTKKDCEAVTMNQFYNSSIANENNLSDNNSIFAGSNIKHFKEFQYFTGVYNIGEGAFRNIPSLTEIAFPSTLVRLYFPFYNSPNLKGDIIIPDNITNISLPLGESVLANPIISNNFKGSISVRYGVSYQFNPNNKVISNFIYFNNALVASPKNKNKYVTIRNSDFPNTNPNLGNVIENGAFNNDTVLETVFMPDRLKSVCGFSGCTNLQYIELNCDLVYPYTFDNCNSLKLLDMSKCTFTSYQNRGGNSGVERVVLPKTCTELAYEAFKGWSALKSINLENVTKFTTGDQFKGSGIEYASLNENANLAGGMFRDSTLINIDLPKTDTIPSECFYGCSKLKSLDLKYITKILYNNFTALSSLTDLYNIDNVEQIQSFDINGTIPYFENLKNNTPYDSNNCIMFNKHCIYKVDPSATNIVLNDNIYTIGSRSFMNSKITEITLNKVKCIGEYAFVYSDLQKIDFISDDLEYIGNNILYQTKVIESTFNCKNGASITSPYKFCTALKKVTISSDINISQRGFENCTELEELIITGDYKLGVAWNMFGDTPKLKNITYNVPVATAIKNFPMNNYKGNGQWGANSSIETITCLDGIIDYVNQKINYN